MQEGLPTFYVLLISSWGTAYFWKETAAYLHKEMARPAGLEPATVGLEVAFSGYNSTYLHIVTLVPPAITY